MARRRWSRGRRGAGRPRRARGGRGGLALTRDASISVGEVPRGAVRARAVDLGAVRVRDTGAEAAVVAVRQVAVGTELAAAPLAAGARGELGN